MASGRIHRVALPRPAGRDTFLRRFASISALALSFGALGLLLPLAARHIEGAGAPVAALPVTSDTARLAPLASRPVRLALIDRLGLDRDPDFAGQPADTAEVALDLLTGREPPPSDPRERAFAALETKLRLEPDGAGGTALLLDLDDPAKAATLLSQMAPLIEAVPPAAPAVAGDHQRRIDDFRKTLAPGALEAALAREAELARLTAESERLVAARRAADLARARIAAGGAAGGDLAPAQAAALAEEADALAALAGVKDKLGPRHPAYIAARAALDAAEARLAQVTAAESARLKTRAEALAREEAALQLKRDGLYAEDAAAGVDLARYRALVADDGPLTAAVPAAPLVLGPPGLLPLGPRPLPALDMLYGGLAGLGAGLLFGLAAWPARRPAPAGTVPAAPVAPVQEAPAEPEVRDEIRSLTDEVAALRGSLAAALGVAAGENRRAA